MALRFGFSPVNLLHIFRTPFPMRPASASPMEGCFCFITIVNCKVLINFNIKRLVVFRKFWVEIIQLFCKKVISYFWIEIIQSLRTFQRKPFKHTTCIRCLNLEYKWSVCREVSQKFYLHKSFA